MGRKKLARSQGLRKRPPVTPRRATVAFWEDDPGDPKSQPPLSPITGPAPNQSAQPLPYKLGGKAPAPQIYQPGTINFVFYANASALRRTASFWGGIVPARTTWQVGRVLPVHVDSGVDLNAFYTRGGGGESPGSGGTVLNALGSCQPG